MKLFSILSSLLVLLQSITVYNSIVDPLQQLRLFETRVSPRYQDDTIK